MLNRYDVQRVIEEWRDDAVREGADHGYLAVLFDEEMLKDLARHLIWKIRENA